MPTLKYVTNTYKDQGYTFDQVWLLMACAPLILPSDLIAAEHLLTVEPSKPVMAIAEYPAPIEWAFRRNKNGQLTPLQPGMFSVRSQDLTPAYYDAGAFVGFPTSFVENSAESGSDTGYSGYILSKETAIDIDTIEDWALAEKIMVARQNT
jgi:N-acylneuraminate cytidylyltransferase